MAIFGIPTLIAIIFGLAFVAGVATIPLLAYSVGDALPGFISEPIAYGLFAIAFLGMDKPVLLEREDDRYEIVEGAGTGPEAYWTNWALSRFGVAAELTADAFDDLVADSDRIEQLSADDDLPGGMAREPDMDRGGKQWYVRPDATPDIRVPIGRALARVKGNSGWDLGTKAIQAGEKEYGGDTADLTAKWLVIGWIFMVAMGAISGFVVFF